jgi:hypothetical protein
MKDYSEQYLHKITAHKLENLAIADGLYPAYHGFSLLNLPASLSNWFNAPGLSHPPLAIPELDTLVGDAKKVVLVLLDALSFSRFKEWMSSSSLENSFLEGGSLFPLTSVTPSTTSTALTTIWTGRSPAEHGILGYELFLREFGMVANMITHSPAALAKPAGMLYQAGFNPEKALPVPNLGPQLSSAGVETFALLPRHIMYSGLSRMHYPQVDIYGYTTVRDLWHGAKQLFDLPLPNRRLIWIYFDALDALSHQYGPDADQVRTEFLTFMQSMRDILIDGISAPVGGRSILMIISDHGQISTPDNPHFDLSKHPSLTNCLHMQPAGEHRLAYLYIRPGQKEAVREYVDRTWPRAFQTLDSSYALELGLFGPGDPADEARFRIGDQIVLSNANNYLWWSNQPNPLRGRHGGLSTDEMLIPLFTLPLGA